MILGKYCGEYVISTCKSFDSESKINEFCFNMNLSENNCVECNKKTYTIQTDSTIICAICFKNKKL